MKVRLLKNKCIEFEDIEEDNNQMKTRRERKKEYITKMACLQDKKQR